MTRRLLAFLGVFWSAHLWAASQEAIFAGGCFWCLEADFDKVSGVEKTTSGYDGGMRKNPSYKQVASGQTGYVEVVKVRYDPAKVSYSELVRYFLRHIDPTDKGGQFCDRGAQYQSAIFYMNAQQKMIAEKALAQLSRQFSSVATFVRPSTSFYPAEGYHQNYYQKNPLRYKYYRWSCGRDKRVKEVWKNVP